MPFASKLFVDHVLGHLPPHTPFPWLDAFILTHPGPRLFPLIVAASVGATPVNAAITFALSQILGVAAQRAITDVRNTVPQHVMRLPVRFFDSPQTGILISRIMTDAEGVRNLVGNGLVQLVGGVLTAVVVLVVLFTMNWKLTLDIAILLVAFSTA